MSPEEFRAALKTLGLSINAAGRYFHVNERTAHRWAADGCPHNIGVLLRLMISLNTNLADRPPTDKA